MKAFKKWWEKNMVMDTLQGYEDCKEGWKESLKWANKLFLDGMHPQDVIFAIQEELEKE